MPRLSAQLTAAALILALAAPRVVQAEATPTTTPALEPIPTRDHRLRWEPHWPRHRVWQYGLTAAAFGLLTYVQFGTYTTGKPSWTGPILFDGAVRDAIRLRTPDQRHSANIASDVTWGIAWAFPLADSLIVALAVDRNVDLAWQMMAINAQVFAIVGFASRAMHKATKRQRPGQAACAADPSYGGTCGGSPASFFSGHTALTAAAAGLTCVHHQFLPLYGGGWADRAACAAALAASVTTGLLRTMSDRHYISDVLVGGTFGFLVGYGLPRLLHYRYPVRLRSGRPRKQATGARLFSVVPLAGEDRYGVTVLGLF